MKRQKQEPQGEALGVVFFGLSRFCNVQKPAARFPAQNSTGTMANHRPNICFSRTKYLLPSRPAPGSTPHFVGLDQCDRYTGQHLRPGALPSSLPIIAGVRHLCPIRARADGIAGTAFVCILLVMDHRGLTSSFLQVSSNSRPKPMGETGTQWVHRDLSPSPIVLQPTSRTLCPAVTVPSRSSSEARSLAPAIWVDPSPTRRAFGRCIAQWRKAAATPRAVQQVLVLQDARSVGGSGQGGRMHQSGASVPLGGVRLGRLQAVVIFDATEHSQISEMLSSLKRGTVGEAAKTTISEIFKIVEQDASLDNYNQ
ncbi:hypothetical protein DFH08DRAFT_423722 [Mycena albidolilacea]|uniref:Uncharacterized protein n=1 Tax=Mycena albidolilacea TaxID=1033008 RepID=A0AAD6ZC62_9AGAR|nr:hypothetical protein DFH08DRAFT_423722 [Mycena albidolilacea]